MMEVTIWRLPEGYNSKIFTCQRVKTKITKWQSLAILWQKGLQIDDLFKPRRGSPPRVSSSRHYTDSITYAASTVINTNAASYVRWLILMAATTTWLIEVLMSSVMIFDTLSGDHNLQLIERYWDASIVTNGLNKTFFTGLWCHPYIKTEKSKYYNNQQLERSSNRC